MPLAHPGKNAVPFGHSGRQPGGHSGYVSVPAQNKAPAVRAGDADHSGVAARAGILAEKQVSGLARKNNEGMFKLWKPVGEKACLP